MTSSSLLHPDSLKQDLLKGTEGVLLDSAKGKKILKKNVRQKISEIKKTMTKAEVKEKMASFLEKSSGLSDKRVDKEKTEKSSSEKLEELKRPKKSRGFLRKAFESGGDPVSDGRKAGTLIGTLVGLFWLPFNLIGGVALGFAIAEVLLTVLGWALMGMFIGYIIKKLR